MTPISTHRPNHLNHQKNKTSFNLCLVQTNFTKKQKCVPKKKIKLLLVRNYIRRHQERFVRKEKKKYLQKKKQEKIYLRKKKYNDKSENPSRRSNLWQRWLLVKSSLCLCQRSFRKWGEVLTNSCCVDSCFRTCMLS